MKNYTEILSELNRVALDEPELVDLDFIEEAKSIIEGLDRFSDDYRKAKNVYRKLIEAARIH